MELKVGSVVEGTVVSIAKFGAFVSLGEGKSGLVHISEIADAYVSDVSAFLKTGQAVKVRVMAVDPDGKIRLSIKRAADRPAPDRSSQGRDAQSFRQSSPAPCAASAPSDAGKSEKDSLDDMLKRFMSESNANLGQMNGKRSGYERRSAKKPGRRNYDD
ncbi:MAG: S1 RNA-binding domain-containing protein [Clostridia bacterium]|nr:S1 RNA-binding domain-containing protein [Clostridia bacterium]